MKAVSSIKAVTYTHRLCWSPSAMKVVSSIKVLLTPIDYVGHLVLFTTLRYPIHALIVVVLSHLVPPAPPFPTLVLKVATTALGQYIQLSPPPRREITQFPAILSTVLNIISRLLTRSMARTGVVVAYFTGELLYPDQLISQICETIRQKCQPSATKSPQH